MATRNRRPASSHIVQEIKQSRPFPSRTQEGVVSLLRTADVLRRRITPVVEQHGVTLQQYNVLRILRGAGAEGLPTLEIASRMIEQAPGITRLLDRLETKGLVRRERCPHDRRQVLVWISDAGRTLLTRMDVPVEETDRSVLGGVDERELATLLRLLDKVRATADE